MERIECPFLFSDQIGIRGCEELGEILPSFDEGVPVKSIRCPLGVASTADCRVSPEAFQKYLDSKSTQEKFPTL